MFGNIWEQSGKKKEAQRTVCREKKNGVARFRDNEHRTEHRRHVVAHHNMQNRGKLVTGTEKWRSNSVLSNHSYSSLNVMYSTCRFLCVAHVIVCIFLCSRAFLFSLSLPFPQNQTLYLSLFHLQKHNVYKMSLHSAGHRLWSSPSEQLNGVRTRDRRNQPS